MILHLLVLILLAVCVVSCAFWLVALACLHRVLRRRPPQVRFEPFVSILKPVKGIDAGALENFASFCEQAYPSYEILFGVADPRDPAVGLVEQIRTRYPSLSIRVLTAGPLGTNPKAATLHRLAAEARGDVLVICDSDIRVTPEFLGRVVKPLHDPKVGLVTCLYRGEIPQNLPARLEALHMDAAFAPSVALAWKLGTDVGLGATVVMRRGDLARAGGYAGCADHLLDDYEIAARIARLGLKIHLSDYAVASVLGPLRFTHEWGREVRWSRGIRVSGPARYLGMIITFTFPLALLATLLSGGWRWAWAAVGASLAVREFVAWRSAVLLGQRERTYLAVLPVRDLLSVAVWCVGLFGRTVVWRGQQFILRRDGRLEEVRPPALPNGVLARAIRRLDAYLRKRDGIFEFTDDSRCVLRVHLAAAESDICFSDGTMIRRGDPVGVLHLWNEHLATIPDDGPDLRWGSTLRRSLLRSFEALAHAAERDPRLARARAFGGNAVFVSRNGAPQIARMARRYGLEWITDRPAPTLGRRIHDFFENFLILGLQWAYNPRGVKGKGFVREREPLWMTRQTLLERYAQAPVTAEQQEPVTVPD